MWSTHFYLNERINNERSAALGRGQGEGQTEQVEASTRAGHEPDRASSPASRKKLKIFPASPSWLEAAGEPHGGARPELGTN
jgi:hypothetical protein